MSFWTTAGLRLRWQMEQLGVPGKIGVGLIIFSAVFFIVAVLPLLSSRAFGQIEIEF